MGKITVNRKILVLSGIFILFLSGCSEKLARKKVFSSVSTPHVTQKAENPSSITIWIHGTRLFPRGILENFHYAKPNINPAMELDTKYHTRTIADSLIKADPIRFPQETFYIFGWSGKLDSKERKHSARTLYKELTRINNEFKKQYGKKPIIRIITHSHGGNVALNLATIKNKNHELVIDELILLACPVQEETAHLTEDPLFKKIYALHSSLDLIQIIDPQHFHKKATKKTPLFSHRYFPPQEKITQTKIKMGKRAITHIEFILPPFLSYAPTILNEMDKWKEESIQRQAQGLPKEKLLVVCTKNKKIIKSAPYLF